MTKCDIQVLRGEKFLLITKHPIGFPTYIDVHVGYKLEIVISSNKTPVTNPEQDFHVGPRQ